MRNIVKDVLYRYEENPLVTREDIPFRCNTVFNGSPVMFNGEYLILMRVEGQQGYSFFTLARSNKGFVYKVDEKPVMLPVKTGKFEKYEKRGIEDPRITFLNGTYYILYTAYSGYGPRIAIAKTEDFEDFERIALISEPGNKDGVLFPEKINGMYARLDRPIGNDIGSIWISYSEDLVHWGLHKPVVTPRPGYWDSYRLGASAPPIKTDRGWLEIFHGVRMVSSGPIYHAGTVLLDLEDPSKIISRSNEPILSPREDYERIGDVNNVVFACGAIVEEDGTIKVFYGAADTSICMAIGNLDELLEFTCND